MRQTAITCDRCGREGDEKYAAQSGWVAFRIEPMTGPAYPYRRDLCADCAGVVLEFIG